MKNMIQLLIDERGFTQQEAIVASHDYVRNLTEGLHGFARVKIRVPYRAVADIDDYFWFMQLFWPYVLDLSTEKLMQIMHPQIEAFIAKKKSPPRRNDKKR